MKKNFLFWFFFILSGVSSLHSTAQDPTRFKAQVDEIVKKEYPLSGKKKAVVFTGSSTMRMWKDVQSCFPGITAINTGFGGSHMSDLLYYYKELIVRFSPDKVLIYEGDNDLNSRKEPLLIVQQARELVEKIRAELSEAEIIFISPKPSPSRWKLKDQYLELNDSLKKMAKSYPNVKFASVWNIMLTPEGRPRPDIFLQDSLHMNKKGYDLWEKALKKYVR